MTPQTHQPDPLNLVVTMPYEVRAEDKARRLVSFETSREGVVDREGEDIAADALWDSRQLFLDQGNIDLNHWSWLGNPYGSGAAPEYAIGRPVDVSRKGKSIFVLAEINTPSPTMPQMLGATQTGGPQLPGARAQSWADWFWDTLTGSTPTRWFPSVFGKVLPGGKGTTTVNGVTIPILKKLEWYSVGLAQRAQHPALGPVALGNAMFAKATHSEGDLAVGAGALVLDYSTFAKAVQTVGAIQTDSAQKEGVQALTPTNPEYAQLSRTVASAALSGQIKPSLAALTKAFEDGGCDPDRAYSYAQRLLKGAALSGSRARKHP